jgi:NADPH:quinone reductase-like Zn-dependent oxidoreductase
MKTKVVRFHEFGGPEVLRFESLEVGEPGEVRVRIESIGLNRAEAAFRSGRYIEKAQLPARLGYEAAGIVEALGEGVKGVSVGEPICVMPAFSMNKYGVYAERAIVPAVALLKRPGGWERTNARPFGCRPDRVRGAYRHFQNRRGGRGDHYRSFQQRGGSPPSKSQIELELCRLG